MKDKRKGRRIGVATKKEANDRRGAEKSERSAEDRGMAAKRRKRLKRAFDFGRTHWPLEGCWCLGFEIEMPMPGSVLWPETHGSRRSHRAIRPSPIILANRRTGARPPTHPESNALLNVCRRKHPARPNTPATMSTSPAASAGSPRELSRSARLSLLRLFAANLPRC